MRRRRMHIRCWQRKKIGYYENLDAGGRIILKRIGCMDWIDLTQVRNQ